MANDIFINALKELLIDRANDIDYSEISLGYRKCDERIDELYKQIKSLLDENGRNLLLNLDTEHNGRMTKVAEICYQRGFSEGVKLVICSLVVN